MQANFLARGYLPMLAINLASAFI